jgi:hypothetical protein
MLIVSTQSCSTPPDDPPSTLAPALPPRPPAFVPAVPRPPLPPAPPLPDDPVVALLVPLVVVLDPDVVALVSPPVVPLVVLVVSLVVAPVDVDPAPPPWARDPPVSATCPLHAIKRVPKSMALPLNALVMGRLRMSSSSSCHCVVDSRGRNGSPMFGPMHPSLRADL